VPFYGAGQDFVLLEEFLDVVFAEVRLEGWLRRGGWFMQREDIVCGFEFGDGDEADLECRVVSRLVFGGLERWVGVTSLLPWRAALMREVMLAMFSVSCFARWGFMCMSSAMADAGL